MGQRYRRMEDQKPWPVLALHQESAKGRGFNSKVKTSELDDVIE